MSKSYQRKQSARSLGRRDARRGKEFRWFNHPNLSDYVAGYNEQLAEIETKQDWWLVRLAKRIQEKLGYE